MMKKSGEKAIVCGLAAMLFIVSASGCGKSQVQSADSMEETERDNTGDSEKKADDLQDTDSGADGETATIPENEKRDTSEEWNDFAEETKDKYKDSETVFYSEDIYIASQDEEFYIDCKFDPIALEIETYDQIVGIYTDPELTNLISSTYTWADDQKKAYIISPGKYTPFVVSDSQVKNGMLGYTSGESLLFHDDTVYKWGNLGTLYMAQWRNLETGEMLDKPVVTVILLENELEAPTLRLVSTEDGIARFEWNAVEGAEEYWIIDYRIDLEGKIDYYATLEARTTDTYWETSGEEGYTANKELYICSISEEDWRSKTTLEMYGDIYDPADGPILREENYIHYFAVMAANSEGTSTISNGMSTRELASLFPYKVTNLSGFSEETEEGEKYHTTVSGVPMLPAYRYIVMCDGRMVPKLIEYDYEKAKEVTEQYLDWEDEEDIEGTAYFVYMDVIEIPYTIAGTPFAGYIKIKDYDRENWKTQLHEIQQRQDQLRNRTGTLKYSITSMDGSLQQQDGEAAVTSEILGGEVTANSALSEYLAVCMVSSVEYVDLSMFSEANDVTYLTDAWLEALYQNPMALGVEGAYLSEDRKGLYFVYQDDAETRSRKQEEIRAEVKRVIDEIITDDMTDMEKEYAINRYLCDTAEYDMAALENAEEYDFMFVDPEYNDSFNAYGVLINKVGVCSSYSAAFKLLADEAGLDCIVVTGYLDGATPHAWNRVNLDGNWETIDVTNNDNDYLANALLNVPDYALKKTLVENTEYVMDTQIGLYVSENVEHEYYRVTGNYYDMDEIVDQFAEQLATQDIVVLRTDYELTEDEFYMIAYEVMERMQNDSLGGCYWLGTIALTTSY